MKEAAGGHGIGLRVSHYPEILKNGLATSCVEAITENFLERGGRPHNVLEAVRKEMPVLLHGVGLSVGSLSPLDERYLQNLRCFIERIDPWIVSDHLCFGRFGEHYAHDLWPLPMNEECLVHVVDRLGRVQDQLGRRIAVENVSSYVEFQSSTIPEWEFVAEVADRADCQVLLDINNVYVNARNHEFDPVKYISRLPPHRVVQYHLAGHQQCDGYLFDDHGSAVSDGVWALYREALRHIGPRPTIIEWDERVPELSVVLQESARAESIERDTLGTTAASRASNIGSASAGGDSSRGHALQRGEAIG